ncbi:MAG: zinc-ribbon domain-containing protein [Bryobacteraceae bacterium]|nr:zinc-ribbon domain-containing protein [Bryobacteraceae bacterium]
MPYCTQCGNRVQDTDVFCGRCGARQRQEAHRCGPALPGCMSPRTASLLCYIPVLGWIAAIVVLASERFHEDRTVRFHAFQGLYLFVAWLLVDWVISPLFDAIPVPRTAVKLLQLAIFCAWVFMIIKVSQGQAYRLPVFGELADRSVSEQR